MLKSKLARAFVLSVCITVFSISTAFAETGGGQSGAFQGQQAASESSLLDKQREIDKYVFKDHAREIADKGFKVTHTAHMGSFVEIGITPYSEENANYLYEVFGKSMVKVVEGQQIVLMDAASDVKDTSVSSPAIDVQDTSVSSPEINLKDTSVSGPAIDEPSVTAVEGDEVKTMVLEAGNGSQGELHTMYTAAKDGDVSGMASSTLIILLCSTGVLLFAGAVFVIRRNKLVRR